MRPWHNVISTTFLQIVGSTPVRRDGGEVDVVVTAAAAVARVRSENVTHSVILSGWQSVQP
jgi:hypothetical protein